MNGGSLEQVRRRNLGAVLRQVHVHGAVSRAKLTVSLGLSRSTVGALTADLGAAGLVREEQPASRGGTGRPSIVVLPSPRVFVYALSVGADEITAARVGLGGGILQRHGAARGRGVTDPTRVAGTAAALVGELHQAAPPDAACVGVAAAVSGSVRRADGSAGLAGASGEMGEALGRALGEVGVLDGQAVLVGASADLGALAEHTRGCAVDARDVVYLHGDAGVGGGIIVGGRPAAGRGGAMGHMVVDLPGRVCGCGGRGCWETRVGEQALVRVAGRQGYGHDAVLAVLDAASWGEEAATQALREVGDWLGVGVANLVNIFSPDTVVFGGTLRPVYLAAAAQVRGCLERHALPFARERVRLRAAFLGEDAPLIGAAELAFERLLDDPVGAVTG